MAEEFFTICARSIAPSDWGDYGDILQHGMTAHLERVGGRLALERTGPYIPPITLPGIGDIVVTSNARALLESSGLSGLSFLCVEKVLIVELYWEAWDLSAAEPAQFPESGEPEDYILGKPHSERAAKAMGELWEISVPPNARIVSPMGMDIARSHKELQIDLNTWQGDDLFRGSDYGPMLFSKRACDWFFNQWATYIEFDEFPSR